LRAEIVTCDREPCDDRKRASLCEIGNRARRGAALPSEEARCEMVEALAQRIRGLTRTAAAHAGRDGDLRKRTSARWPTRVTTAVLPLPPTCWRWLTTCSARSRRPAPGLRTEPTTRVKAFIEGVEMTEANAQDRWKNTREKFDRKASGRSQPHQAMSSADKFGYGRTESRGHAGRLTPSREPRMADGGLQSPRAARS